MGNHISKLFLGLALIVSMFSGVFVSGCSCDLIAPLESVADGGAGCSKDDDCPTTALPLCKDGKCVATQTESVPEVSPEVQTEPVICKDDTGCKNGFMCEGGTCVPRPECTDDGGCKNGFMCKDGKCVVRLECTMDGDCKENYKCASGKCVSALACKTNTDCTTARHSVCKNNTCVQCVSLADCFSNETCNTTTNMCEQKPSGCVDGVPVAKFKNNGDMGQYLFRKYKASGDLIEVSPDPTPTRETHVMVMQTADGVDICPDIARTWLDSSNKHPVECAGMYWGPLSSKIDARGKSKCKIPSDSDEPTWGWIKSPTCK